MKYNRYLYFLFLSLLFTIIVEAQIPRTLSYQGILTDSVGNPKPDGMYSMMFSLYTVASGGTATWV